MMKRSLGVVLVLAMVAVACGSGASTQSPAGSAQNSKPSISNPPTPAILGTWQRDYKCRELVDALDHAAVGEFAPGMLVGLHMLKGPVDRLNGSNLCEGAKKVQQTHVFRENGYLLTYQGSTLEDDCRCYTLVGDHTFVNLAEPGYPDISLHYVIDGNTLTFDVVMPDQCSARCKDQVQYVVGQYAVGPWQRVN